MLQIDANMPKFALLLPLLSSRRARHVQIIDSTAVNKIEHVMRHYVLYGL
jgi:hypothetical protein